MADNIVLPFKRAVIRRREDNQPLDKGRLAEALLYFGHTQIILDHGSTRSLLEEIGPENLLEILENGYASATFFLQTMGCRTLTHATGIREYSIDQIELVGNKSVGKLRGKERIAYAVEQELGKSKATNAFANRFCDVVDMENLSDGVPEIGIPGLNQFCPRVLEEFFCKHCQRRSATGQ
ncbi:MAG: hypothetical protein J3T61_12770, partial [Candidatus Brocadiales bacterium]|nr:hypothetical protein [Candidatus Bathyanammoxibius sp.]